MQLPFFIGSVDTQRHTLSLHSTMWVSKAFFESGYNAIRLDLDNNQEQITTDRSFRSINLGKPILTCTAAETYDPGFLDHCFAIMKQFVEVEISNLKTRKFHVMRILSWNTNEVPIESGNWISNNPRSVEAAQELYRSIGPQIQKIGTIYAMGRDLEGQETIRRFVDLMRANGVDPDPTNNIGIGGLFRLFEHLHEPEAIPTGEHSGDPQGSP
jgi:hypothetical protein